MTTRKALNGKSYAGNPHVRFDERAGAPMAKPRRWSPLYNKTTMMAVALCATSCVVGNVSRADGEISVGTYNIRLMPGDKGMPNAWNERNDGLVWEIAKMNLDVFGMQEVFPAQAAYITNALPQYAVVGDYREKDRVIYVSKGVEVLEHKTYADPRPCTKLYPSDHFPVTARIVLPD